MIIGLDVDDVLLSLMDRWLYEYNEAYDDNLQKHDINAWETWKFTKPECGKRIYRLLHPTMYDWVEPEPSAAAFVQNIRDRGHTPRYVTACGDPKKLQLHRRFATAKWNALIRHGIAEYGELLLPGKDKSRAPVDMLIDDRAHNCTGFRNGMAVLFTQPWNEWLQDEGKYAHIERADTFTEALALIDYYDD